MSQSPLIGNQIVPHDFVPLLHERAYQSSVNPMCDPIAPRSKTGRRRRMPVLSEEMIQPLTRGVCGSLRADRALASYWHRESSSESAAISDSPTLEAPVLFIKTLFETWRVAEDAATLLGLDERDARDLFDGASLNGRDLKDRIVCLYQIRKNLWSLLRDNEVENEWLREPHDVLDGRAPLDLLREGSMENLLLVKEYVDAVAGL